MPLFLAAGLATAAEPATPPRAVDLPRVPHEASPDEALYPDYFTAALPLADVAPDTRFASVRWHGAGAMPAVVVLPVQSQAWAVSAWVRALAGARLDVAIARRGVEAGRQTDVVDADGPFVRRLDEATIAAFAAAHASTVVLVPYVGRDADGQAFVTLQKRSGSRVDVAHERVAMPDSLLPAVDALSAALERELATLQVGSADAPAPAAERAGCNADDWRLADAVSGPVGRACRALVVGTLMPHLAPLMSPHGALLQPDRLAWLAAAWAQSQALAPRVPVLRDATALAAWELVLEGAAPPASADVDPVVRILGRLVQARTLASHSPQRSTNEAARKIADEAVAGLPPFAAALGHERVRLDDVFSKVDFCGLATLRSQVAAAPGCVGTPGAAAPSAADAALLQAWRVATAVKAILVEAVSRGDIAATDDVLHALPADLAAHPLVGEAHVRALLARPDAANREEFVARSQAIASLVLPLLATMQRDDPLLRTLDLKPANFERVGLEPDAAMLRFEDKRARLQSVLSEDEFGDAPQARRIAPGMPALFLVPGRFLDAQASIAATPAAVDTPPGAAADWRTTGAIPAPAVFEKALARTPNDSAVRVGAALATLKHGATVSEATVTVDARAVDERADCAICESKSSAVAPNVFFLDGEMLAARRWFERVVALDTYSGADLGARTRLRLIEGDVPGALVAARQAFERYGDESDLRDVAGLSFAQGRDADAWALLLPRLATTPGGAPWVAALSGLRRAGVEASAMPAWLDAHALGRNQLGREALPLTLAVEASLLDRVGDVPALQSMETARPALRGASALAALLQSALAPGEHAADVDQLRALFTAAPVDDAPLWRPFLYAAAWQASTGKAPLLDDVRMRTVNDNFEGLLAAWMVAALDGRHERALRLQHAARYEIATPVLYRGRIDDAWQTAPYRFVLAGWLVAQRTGDRSYLAEPLQLARDYERVKPYWAWPLAFDALAGSPEGRDQHLCQARALDSKSMFLALADPHPRAGACGR